MGKRAVLAGTAVTASLILLSACTAPPEPPLGSPGPKLDPDAVAYDNVEFQTTKQPLFDNTCQTLPKNLKETLGLQGRLVTMSLGGCASDEQWGQLKFSQYRPTERKSKQVYFADIWKGESGAGTSFERLIVADRYYAVATVYGYVNDTCMVIVDTGSVTPLQVEASVPREQHERLSKQDADMDTRQVLDTYCPRALDAATKLLALADPNGGSRAR